MHLVTVMYKEIGMPDQALQVPSTAREIWRTSAESDNDHTLFAEEVTPGYWVLWYHESKKCGATLVIKTEKMAKTTFANLVASYAGMPDEWIQSFSTPNADPFEAGRYVYIIGTDVVAFLKVKHQPRDAQPTEMDDSIEFVSISALLSGTEHIPMSTMVGPDYAPTDS